MQDEAKTKKQLLSKLAKLRQQIVELETAQSERRRAFQEDEERYHLIAENVTDIIWTLDIDMRPTYVSPSIERVLGYRIEELIGQPIEKFTTPATFEFVTKVYERMMTEGNTVQDDILKWVPAEVEVIRKDGSIVWLENKMTVLRDQNGSPIGGLGISRDVTERKQREDELVRTQRNLELVLSSTPAVLYVCEPSPPYGTTFMGGNAFELTGYEAEEFYQNPSLWADNIHPEDAPRIFNELSLLFERGYHSHEYRFRRKDSDYVWMYDESRLVRDSQGNPKEIFGYWVDISEHKKIDEELKKSLREKETLLKELHHRVKNNLQVISSILSLQSASIKDPRVVAALKDTETRIRAMAIVHEELYKSDGLASIDLGGYIKSLARNLLRSYGEGRGNIAVEVAAAQDVETGLDIAIPCGLIVNELVSNCFKHAFPAGQQGEIHISLQRRNGENVLKVADNGIGFPEGLDFRNADSLGLQLVASLVDQLEGRIEMDKGYGTSFMITFHGGGRK